MALGRRSPRVNAGSRRRLIRRAGCVACGRMAGSGHTARALLPHHLPCPGALGTAAILAGPRQFCRLRDWYQPGIERSISEQPRGRSGYNGRPNWTSGNRTFPACAALLARCHGDPPHCPELSLMQVISAAGGEWLSSAGSRPAVAAPRPGLGGCTSTGSTDPLARLNNRREIPAATGRAREPVF